jgi:hypothetical protein
MKILKKVLEYLNFTKKYKAKNEEEYNLVFMNRMNRISIYVFIIAIIVLVIRYVK